MKIVAPSLLPLKLQRNVSVADENEVARISPLKELSPRLVHLLINLTRISYSGYSPLSSVITLVSDFLVAVPVGHLPFPANQCAKIQSVINEVQVTEVQAGICSFL